MKTHAACHRCGLVHRLPRLANDEAAACVRCDSIVFDPVRAAKSAGRTAAAALGALVLFFPAVSLPILEIERLGHRRASSILTGTWDLVTHGNWFVGLVVFLFSIVFPLVKLCLLLDLSLLGLMHRRYRGLAYRLVESMGRWSMMDVLLLAFLVMLVKLGNLVSFQVGPAVFAFVLCVVMSMAASLFFDPHALWDSE
jgi:paraquat-inducible protein A